MNFNEQSINIFDSEMNLRDKSLESISESLRDLKSDGFSDKRLANILATTDMKIFNS